MTKILFIDFDGPLIPAKIKFFEHKKTDKIEHWSTFDPFAVSFLNLIFEEEPELYAVLHTSWRKVYDDEFLINHMKNQGCNFRLHSNLIAPYKFSSDRWYEIFLWLSDHPEISKKDYAIIDDETPTESFKEQTVKIDYENGFNYNDCSRLLNILNINLPGYL